MTVTERLQNIARVIDRNHVTPRYQDEGIPLVSPASFSQFGVNTSVCKRISEQDYKEEIKRCRPESGDILFSRIGTVGKVRWAPNEKFIPLHSLVLIKPDEDKVDPAYLYYCLKSDAVGLQARKGVQSIGVPDLGIKKIRNFRIPLPPRVIQAKIASILQRSEKLIEARLDANHLIQEIIRSIFLRMFGDPFLNPHGLPVDKIKNVVELINGKAFKSSDWKKSGRKIIRIQNLNNPSAKFNYYSGKIEERYIVRRGDLLLSWSGTPGTSFGAFIWTGQEAVLNQHIFNVKPKQGNLNKCFLQYLIKLKLPELISKAHGGVGLQHITKSRLNEVEIFMPPLDLQEAFASLVQEVENLGKRQAQSTLEVNELFNSLMQKAFRGELTI